MAHARGATTIRARRAPASYSSGAPCVRHAACPLRSLYYYRNRLKPLLLLFKGASLRRRLSWASGLKYFCHISGASLLSPPCLVIRWRTRQIIGVLTAAPAIITWPFESAGK